MISDKYIKDIKRELKKQYGEIPDSWGCQLSILADDLKLYNEMSAIIAEEGAYDKDSKRKHPLLAPMKDLKNSILKSVNAFGMSAYAAKRLKSDDLDDAEDFIDNLCN